MYECCQHCCRGWRGGGSACQFSDHMTHTASNWSAWLLSQKEASSKDDAQESPQTVLDYWNHVLWSDETNINLFCSDGVKRVWRQPGEEYKRQVCFCLQSSMVVGVSWSGAAWVLPALGSHSSLREPWMPTCTVTYWSRAWSPPFGDWATGQFFDMITTTAFMFSNNSSGTFSWVQKSETTGENDFL